MKIGLLPLGRPTFDVAFAETKLAAMLAALEATGPALVGTRHLLMDEAETRAAVAALKTEALDLLLILQVTFTDAAMTAFASTELDAPLAIWAIPEPRTGGRLRLNSFCGLNLASHALGLRDRAFSWLYADPERDVATDISALLAGERAAQTYTPGPAPAVTDAGHRVAAAVAGQRIAQIGRHPTGFDTCAYDPERINELAGVTVDELDLDSLFSLSREMPADAVSGLRSQVATLKGIEEVDQPELDRSLRLKLGLEKLGADGGYDAFAIRCWPETFTEYGGAICAPAAMLGEERRPCACEADVYGALTQLILKEVARAPVFLTDVVDIDATDDTGVLWHCGQAPISMRDPRTAAEATVHTNRKKPLLYQFALKPGPVTLVRISQACGTPKMVIGSGEMLRRPMAFTGTSGVLRFARPAGAVLKDFIDLRLEHHVALAYGDHKATLRGVAGAMKLPVVEF